MPLLDMQGMETRRRGGGHHEGSDISLLICEHSDASVLLCG